MLKQKQVEQETSVQRPNCHFPQFVLKMWINYSLFHLNLSKLVVLKSESLTFSSGPFELSIKSHQKIKRLHKDICYSQTVQALFCVCAFMCVCVSYTCPGSSSVCSGPVKGPNEDVWWPRGGPDAEVNNGWVKISVAQSGCFLWGKTDQIYLLSSVPRPPRDHLEEKDLSLMCKYLQKGFFERKNWSITSRPGQNKKKKRRRRRRVFADLWPVLKVSGIVKSFKRSEKRSNLHRSSFFLASF